MDYADKKMAAMKRDRSPGFQKKNERLAALRAAVAIGDEQIDQGEGVVFTPELMDQIMAEAIANTKLCRPVNPDIMP